jgi:hypothetical protein
MFSFAQEIPNMKGKKLSEVISYFDSRSMMYSQEKDAKKNEVIMRALVAQSFSKDSTKETNKLLLLKFNSEELCYYSNHVYESNKIIRMNNAPVAPTSEKLLVQAGSRGIIADVFTLLGAGITIGGAVGNNVGVIILGGAFTLSGVIMNMAAWQKVKQSGEQMEIERKQREVKPKPVIPQMKNPHMNENGEFQIK